MFEFDRLPAIIVTNLEVQRYGWGLLKYELTFLACILLAYSLLACYWHTIGIPFGIVLASYWHIIVGLQLPIVDFVKCSVQAQQEESALQLIRASMLL
jgi:hypothetical protein